MTSILTSMFKARGITWFIIHIYIPAREFQREHTCYVYKLFHHTMSFGLEKQNKDRYTAQ